MNRKLLSTKQNGVKGIRGYILIATVGVLAISSIFLTIETAVTGAVVSNLEKTEAQLEAHKKELESSMVKNQSVTNLIDKSGELGFSKPANLVFVNDVAPVAKLP